MIYFFYTILVLFTFSLYANSSFGPTQALTTPKVTKMSDVSTAHQHNLNVSNYFFSKLPQAHVPQEFLETVRAYYQPLLQFLEPISPDQTVEQRAAEVLGHIEKFYGLLYTTAIFEKGLADKSHNTPQLSLDDVYKSDIWQNYLQISIAESYQQEQDFITRLFCDNQEIFKYLPNFELTYYNNNFIALRNNAEMARLYLLLSESIRKRLCNLSLAWAPLFTETKEAKLSSSHLEVFTQKSLAGLQAIKKFKDDDFFKNIEKLKSINPTDTFPISFNDPNGNPIDFEHALSTYDFSTYFITSEKTNPHPTSAFELFFTITQDPTTKKYNCYFTGLGKSVFVEEATPTDPGFPYGKIEYKTLKLSAGKTQTKAYFVHNALFKSLFNGEPPTPTFGFFCFLTVSSIKYLHIDLTPVFGPEYLDRSLHIVEENRTKYPTFPSCINYAQSDHAILQRINDLYQKMKIDPKHNTTGTPQCGNPFHAIASVFTSAGNAISSGFHTVVHGLATAASAVGHGLAVATDTITHSHIGDATFGKVGDAVASGIDAVGDGIISVAGDLITGVEDAARAAAHAAIAIKDEAIAAYYSTCIFPAMFQGMSFSDALHHAAEYQSAVSQEVTSCMKDLTSTVNDLGKAYEDTMHIAASLAGSVIGIVDKKIGEDVTGMLDAVVDAAVSLVEVGLNFTIEITAETVILTADAIQMIASTIALVTAGMLTGDIAKKDAWSAIGDEGMNLVENTVSAMLAGLSLCLNFLGQELKDAMLCFAYVIQFITQTITVICSAIDALAMFVYTFCKTGNLRAAADAAGDSYWHAYHAIEKYAIIISAVVGIALLIALTVVTGGADIELTGPMMAMLAMNIAMSGFSLAGAIQDNLTAIEKQNREEALVNNYKNYVINNFSVAREMQANRAVESLVQYRMSQDNTERSLLFYQNSYNTQINNTVSQQAYSVGAYVNNLATPNWNLYNSPVSGATLYPYDTSVSVQADMGQLYGINTGRLMLAPSSGFGIYNQGRDTFSQEGLVDPVIIPTQNSSATNSKNELETFWFQQKDLTFLPIGTPVAGDVVWRVTAQRETPFHIGIYLTERAIDLTTLQNLFNNYQQLITGNANVTYDTFKTTWKPFDIYNKYIVDFDSQAKIFVLKRNPVAGQTINANNKTQLGLYVVNSRQHQDNWVPTQFTDIDFERGTWYRMKTLLSNGSMTVAFWKVGDDAAYEKLLQNPQNTPAPLAQATIPVETATYAPDVLGVAPVLKKYSGSMGFVASGAAVEYKVLTPAPTIVETSLRTGEYGNLLNTVYQNTKPMEKDREIAWQHSIQSALNPQFGSLKLTPIDQINIITGMFVYHNNSKNPRDIVTFFTQNSNGVYALNANPGGPVQGIVSLATGLTYDTNGNITGVVSNARKLYERQFTKLPTSLDKEITALQNNFITSLRAPIRLANNTLTLAPVTDTSIFVYQGPSLLIKGVTDFYVTACTTLSGITQYGLPFITNNSHNSINALISITTGMVYYIQTSTQATSPMIPAPSLQPGMIKTLSLVKSSSTYNLYTTYQQYFTGLLNQPFITAYKAYQQYEASLAKEAAFEAQLSNAINAATTAASNASTQAGLVQAINAQAAQSATSAAQAATTAANQLQTLLTQYKQTVATSNTSQINSAYNQAQQQLQATTQATTVANNAATAAETAINSSSNSFGFSTTPSNPGPSNNSSTQNFNTSFGSSTSTFPSGGGSSDSSDSAGF